MVLNRIVDSEKGIEEALNKGLAYLIEEVADRISGLPADTVLGGAGDKIPAVYTWTGIECLKVADVPNLFSDIIPEGLEGGFAAGIEASMAHEILTSVSGKGRIFDVLTDEWGPDLIDGTVPGLALFIGEPVDGSKDEIRYCSDKGLKVILAGGYSNLDIDYEAIRLKGRGTLEINGFLAGTVVRHGNVEPGDRVSVAKYLKKRPKLIVVHTGALTVLDVLTIFSVAATGSYTVTGSAFPEIPRFSERRRKNLASEAMAGRGITFKRGGEIRSGSSFENERVRKADAFFEFGGDEDTVSYEIVRKDEHAEDGRTFVIGKDLHESERGDYPLSLEVRVYGTVESVMEQAIERRIHFALSRMEGVWHSGQRDTCWIRISDSAVKKGIIFKDLGDNIISDIKENFNSAVHSVDVTFSVLPSEVSEGLDRARKHYSARDLNIVGLTDESVNEFYTCTICQTYAPGHICIITPERPSVCGSVTWIDAKVGSEINPNGRQRPFSKGECIDSVKGVWSGVNDVVSKTSMGSTSRVCVHSVADSPMTACSCMEVVATVSEDRRSVILIDRSETEDNPSGMSYSEISAMVGRGSQRPGYMGLGRHYILSPSFLKGDGGLKRVSWMSSRLKSILGDSLKRACEASGDSKLYDKISDGNIVADNKSLIAWVSEMNHPSNEMDPLTL